MTIYKGLKINSAREEDGFDYPVRVWRGYELVQDEFTKELNYQYLPGTAAFSLSNCKEQIDDLVAEEK
tara:strand:- start:1025 stop:1228 length:204 start_codon:yes stop_codon:yes gene_type:complete